MNLVNGKRLIWVEFWGNVFAFCHFLNFSRPINRSSLIQIDSAALGGIFEASELRGNINHQLETPLLRLELRFDHFRQFSPQEIKEKILIGRFHLKLQFQASQILVNSLTHWLFALATVLFHIPDPHSTHLHQSLDPQRESHSLNPQLSKCFTNPSFSQVN